MRIPNLQRGNQYRVTIPALNGGVNLNDAPNLVEDNQLTDVRNMWWKDQALRTRPGLRTETDRVFHIHNSVMGDALTYRVYPPVRIYRDGKPEDYVCCYCEYETSRTCTMFYFYRFDEDGNAQCVSHLMFMDEVVPSESAAAFADDVFLFTANPTEDGIGLYAIFNNGAIYSMTKELKFQRIAKSDIYAPLVVVNATGCKTTDTGTLTCGGTAFEGYNLLGGAFRTAFTTDGTSNQFKLPLENLTHDSQEPERIEYTGPDGNVIVWSGFDNGSIYTEATAEMDGEAVTARIYYSAGLVTFYKNAAFHVLPPSVANNLVVTAWKSSLDTVKKISNMKFSAWFGGDRSGVNGGTRLFAAGNPDYPNRIHWSDINNPLYFPENNYAYIGDSSQKVTGFGKQTNSLVIFKEHEIYCAEYVSGTTYTAQDVLDGKVTDVTANAAVFPITPINAGIGCDCPNTIQLCSNRLIWATSDGHVYGLMAANQASERNVRELSAMIGNRLKAEDDFDLRNAVSCDYDGHYMLFVQNRVYLLDYTDAVFQYYISYSDERKAQRNMLWHFWEFPDGMSLSAIMPKGNRLSVFCPLLYLYTDSYGLQARALFGAACLLEGHEDCTFYPSGPPWTVTVEKQEVQSHFQTKVFDFGSPERKKKIQRLHIHMMDISRARAAVSYVTEKGVLDDVYDIRLSGTGTTTSCVLTPGVSRVNRFGVRIENAGAVGVEGLVIRYERNGEVG